MADANLLFDDESTAFPASPATPGQAESRSAHAVFETMVKDAAVWLDDYYQLRSEGWDWRKAAYIAWASSLATDRWPKTQKDLASNVLGLKSDRTIQKWREDDRGIDDRVAKLQIEPLMRHRRDVIEALISVASSHDPKAASDRRVFLEMVGDYKPKSAMAVTGEDGGPIEVDIETLGARRWAEIAPLLAQLNEEAQGGPSEAAANAPTPVSN